MRVQVNAHDWYEVVVKDGTGAITTNFSEDLPDDDFDDLIQGMLDGVEALILAHACAGIDVAAPAYVQGVRDALEAIGNHA